MLPDRQERGRLRSLPGPALSRLVSIHHPGHARSGLPGRHPRHLQCRPRPRAAGQHRLLPARRDLRQRDPSAVRSADPAAHRRRPHPALVTLAKTPPSPVPAKPLPATIPQKSVSAAGVLIRTPELRWRAAPGGEALFKALSRRRGGRRAKVAAAARKVRSLQTPPPRRSLRTRGYSAGALTRTRAAETRRQPASASISGPNPPPSSGTNRPRLAPAKRTKQVSATPAARAGRARSPKRVIMAGMTVAMPATKTTVVSVSRQSDPPASASAPAPSAAMVNPATAIRVAPNRATSVPAYGAISMP